MLSGRKKSLNILLLLCVSTTSFAADMLGNPAYIGVPGQFAIEIGGGKSSDFSVDIEKSTSTVTIGNLSQTGAEPAGFGKNSEDQVFIGASYAINATTQIFANFGNGKETGQQSSSRTLGFKISPEVDSSDVRMGLILRAQQVDIDVDGPFSFTASINDGTNIHQTFGAVINGTEQVEYTRFDAFFGASRNTGVFRPYGGLCLTKVSGTDTIALSDITTVTSFPVSGGAVTQTNERVTYNTKADISGSKYFTGVLGFSLHPGNNLGLTAEIQAGLQRALMLSGNMGF